MALVSAGSAAGEDAQPADARPELAVMGSIPLYWGEAGDLSDLIGGTQRPHWARAVLEREWRLVPLGFLDAAGLAGEARLLLAQPRPLAPEENVALDSWVAGGGRLLVFVDPMLTGDSRFPVGDRRRPQAIALLSPILAHWGLRLEFDAEQEPGVRARDFAGTSLPVDLAGRFVPTGGGAARCRLESDGLVALCRRGRGRVVLLADAALLDIVAPGEGAQAALERLAGLAFTGGGDFAGSSITSGSEPAENRGKAGAASAAGFPGSAP